MDSKKIKVWAHRGASGYAPENTMDAFRKAIEMKADGIELDVHLTKDGEVVVIHDEVLDRVSDGTGRVQDFTCNELKKFNFNKIHPEYEKEEIPTLEEVYQLIKPTDLTINVEMKTGNTFYPGMEDKVLELTKKYDMMDRIIVSSFNHYTIRSMKEKCPELKTGALYADGIINAVDYVADVVRADALHPGWTKIFYPNYLEDCRRRNILVHVWTINNEEDMRRCCEMGLDAIITNYPDVARKVVDEYQLKIVHAEIYQNNLIYFRISIIISRKRSNILPSGEEINMKT